MRSKKRPVRVQRAGNAGVVASILIALGGLIVGALSTYVSERGQAARAARQEMSILSLREAPFVLAAQSSSPAIAETSHGTNADFGDRLRGGVQLRRGDQSRPANGAMTGLASGPMSGPVSGSMSIKTNGPVDGDHLNHFNLERMPSPGTLLPGTEKPAIIIIFDDTGLNRKAFERIMQLPGPVTFSFLPYAKGIDHMATRARTRGDDVMLHLPMEPVTDADPGPKALYATMNDEDILEVLEWNLSQFNGYIGVNNHMGSRFTASEQSMTTVLRALKKKGLFFLDSLTTGKSAVKAAAANVGTKTYARDVFLDADAGKKAVADQLALVEKIARETGYAVAICHPHADTIDMIGPWLTSAPSRGLQLASVRYLLRSDAPYLSVASEANALRP